MALRDGTRGDVAVRCGASNCRRLTGGTERAVAVAVAVAAVTVIHEVVCLSCFVCCVFFCFVFGLDCMLACHLKASRFHFESRRVGRALPRASTSNEYHSSKQNGRVRPGQADACTYAQHARARTQRHSPMHWQSAGTRDYQEFPPLEIRRRHSQNQCALIAHDAAPSVAVRGNASPCSVSKEVRGQWSHA